MAFLVLAEYALTSRGCFLVSRKHSAGKRIPIHLSISHDSVAMLESFFNPSSYHTVSYKCIGAKLRILLHFLLPSSLPTTPFNLLPIGSPPLLIRTHALSSNLTTLPSGRWYFFAVRTTTACLMSPLRTLFAAETETEPPGPDSGPKFRCFWTTTIMRSPGGGCQEGLQEVRV